MEIAEKIQRCKESTAKEKKGTSSKQATIPSANTPRSRSRAELREAGLSPTSVPPAIKKEAGIRHCLNAGGEGVHFYGQAKEKGCTKDLTWIQNYQRVPPLKTTEKGNKGKQVYQRDP